MAQEIITVSSKKRLQLSNGEATRKMLIGNSWTTLRIGLLASIHSTAAVAGTPRFAFGVCSENQGYGSLVDAGTNLIGIRSNSSTFSFQSDIAANTLYSQSSPQVFKRVGSAFTAGGSISGSMYMGAAADFSVRLGMFLDITKGSPNYSLVHGGINNTADIADLSDANFLSMMELGALTDLNNVISYYDSDGVATTLAMDETGGDLNSLFLYWNRTAPVVSIDAISFRRMA
jgi:hypothetical protein